MKKSWQSLTNTAKILYGFTAVITLYFVVRYASGEALQAFDAAGHVATLRNIAASWPALTSWQPDQLLGLNYGVLYPPLLHWVSAGFGKLIGVEAAFTTLLCLALIALPVSLWWYGTTLRLHKAWLPLFVLAGVMLLSATPDFFGGNVTGLFRLGLTTSFIATPLVIISWAMTEKALRAHSNKWAAGLALLLGALVWSHLVGAIVAFTYTFVALISAIYRRQRTATVRIAASIAGAIVVSLPFIIPFLQSYGRTMGSSSGIISSPVMTILAAGIVALAGYIIIRRKWTVALTPIAAAAVFIAVAALDVLWARANATGSMLYAMNAYRFQIFMLLLTLTATVIVVSRLQVGRQVTRVKPLSIAVALCLGLTLLLLAKNPAEDSDTTVTYTAGSAMAGRFLEGFSRSDSGYKPYTMQTELLRHNPDAQWAYGLFIESEPNALFIKSLSMSLNPNPRQTKALFEPEEVVVDKQRREQLLDLFGISHVITLDTNANNNIGTWQRNGQTKYYHDIARKQPNLAEVPSLPLQPISADWERTVLSWWKSPGAVNYLPYNAAEGELAGSTDSTSVVVNRWDKRGIEVTIGGNAPHLVLVKVPYTPHWSITDDDGNDVPYRQAAPNLLLLSGNGHITLQPGI